MSLLFFSVGYLVTAYLSIKLAKRIANPIKKVVVLSGLIALFFTPGLFPIVAGHGGGLIPMPASMVVIAGVLSTPTPEYIFMTGVLPLLVVFSISIILGMVKIKNRNGRNLTSGSS